MDKQLSYSVEEVNALKEEYSHLSIELKKMQEEICRNFKNIKEFFLVGHGGKIIITSEGEIEEANIHFLEGMGFTSKETLHGRSFLDMVSETDRAALTDAIKKIIEKKSDNHHIIIGMQRADGSVIDASVSLARFYDASEKKNLFFVSVTNITSQLSMHYELEEKKKLLHEAQKLSSFGYWHYSYISKKIFWSDEVFHIFEISKNEDISTLSRIIKHIHPSDHEQFYNFWEANTQKQAVNEATFRIIVTDGSVKYITMKAELEKDRNNRPLRVLGTIVDITETWYREKKILENEELFHSLFNNLTDIFIIFELEFDNEGAISDYIYKDINPLYEMKLGFTRNEVVGKKLSAHLPTIFQQFHPLFKVTAIASQPQQDRLYIQMLDTFFDVLIYSPSQNMLATIWRDVSLMVEAESSLRESEEKYRQIFSIASDALFMADFQTCKILETNPTASKMYGFSRDELLTLSFLDLTFEPQKLRELLNAQVSTLTNEVCIRKDKKKFPVEISLAYFNWNGRKVIFISVRDITERIISQEQLIKSEQKFKQLFDFSNDAILILKNYRIIDFNLKASQLFDSKYSSLVNKTLWSISPGYQSSGEDSRMNAVELLQDTLTGNQHQVEWIFQRDNLSTFVADIKLSPILYGNEKVIQAIIRDITPQKETELALKTDAERWKFALEGSTTGVWDWDIHTNHIYFSPAWKFMLGYQDHELPNLFEEFEKRVHPEDTMRVFDYINSYLEGKINSFYIEFRMQCKNGSYKWILGRGIITSHTPDGKPLRFIGTHDDITRSKILEQNYLTEINKLKQTASMLKTGYWELDLRTMIFHGSPQAFQMLGFGNEPLYLKKLEKIIHPDDKDVFMNLFTSNNPTQTEYLESFRVLIGNETRHIQSYVLPQFDSNNTLSGYLGAFQDITIHKSLESEQEYQQNILKAITDQQYFSILIVQNEQIVFSNRRASDFFGYPDTKLHSQGFSIFELIHLPVREEFHKRINEWANNKGKNASFETEIFTKHRRVKWAEVFAVPLKYLDNESILLIFLDISTRKAKQIELQNSLNSLQLVFEKMEGGVALFNPENKPMVVNPKFKSFLGDLSGVSKKFETSLYARENEKTVFQAVKSIKDNPSIHQPLQISLTSEGGNIWVHLFVSLLPDGTYMVYLQEIDQIKLAETAALHDAQILHGMIESRKYASALFSSSLELIFSNSLFNEQFATLSNESDFTLSYLPFTIKPEFQSFLSGFQQGTASDVSFRFEELNGTVFTIEARHLEYEQMRYIALTIIDETLINNEIAQLKSGYERFYNLFESAPLGMALVDKNRVILQTNKAYTQLLNYNNQELNNKKVDELIPIENLSENLNNYYQIFSGIKGNYTLRQIMLQKGEKPIWVKTDVYASKDRFGNITTAINIIEDITGSIENENRNTVKIRMNTLKTISNSMAHLFNNQFMSIFGSAYLLKSISDDVLIGNYANNIISAMQRWSDHAHKYLFFASQTRTLHIVVDVHQAIREIRNSELLNNFPTISVKYQFDSSQGKIIGDPNHLYTAIQTLMFNALEALPEGGNITISTHDVLFEKDEPGTDQAMIKAGRYIRIRITDTGQGISIKDMPHIFEPFFTTRKNPINPGLGLPLCKLLVTQMGGSVKIFSEPGLGSQANIYLPIPENEKLQKFVVPNEQILLKGSANILLVDDEEVIRIITGEFLQKLGYNVFSFSLGQGAIKFFKENQDSIDLVIIDMQMPIMDGATLFRQLKAIEPKVNVILLSGFNLDERIESLIKEGLSAFIQKPVGIEKLSQAISKVLYNK